MADNMSDIRLNELIDENLKLRECLNVLLKYKIIVDLFLKDITIDSDSVYSPKLKELKKETEDVFKKYDICFSDFNKIMSKVAKEDILMEVEEEVSPHTNTSHNSTKKLIINSNESQKTVQKKKTSIRKHICDVEDCSFWSLRPQYLETHKKKHFPSETFSDDSNLSPHIEEVNELSEERLTCDIDGCQKTFKNEFCLKSHKRLKHLKKNRFFCDFPNCDYSCLLKHHLKSHKTKHSSDRPFICTVEGCHQKFKTQNTLDGHLKTHSFERNYKCEHEGCGNTFKYIQSLRIHEKNYHSDTKYRCDWPGCEFQSKWSAALQKHSVVHSSERNFICDWTQCGKAFKTKPHLDNHMRIHTSDKRYACHWPGCQYRCVDSGGISKHLRVHQK